MTTHRKIQRDLQAKGITPVETTYRGTYQGVAGTFVTLGGDPPAGSGMVLLDRLTFFRPDAPGGEAAGG